MTHLRYDLNTAPKKHPQLVMQELGISYQCATPQSIADLIMFWNCKSIPKVLPVFLEVKNWNPLDFVGFGLSKETALSIIETQSNI